MGLGGGLWEYVRCYDKLSQIDILLRSTAQQFHKVLAFNQPKFFGSLPLIFFSFSLRVSPFNKHSETLRSVLFLLFCLRLYCRWYLSYFPFDFRNLCRSHAFLYNWISLFSSFLINYLSDVLLACRISWSGCLHFILWCLWWPWR